MRGMWGVENNKVGSRLALCVVCRVNVSLGVVRTVHLARLTCMGCT